MYKSILVPVDLEHADRLEKALATAADLSKHYRIPVCYVGVTASTPGRVAHTPQEYAGKLEAFGQAQADKHGIAATTKTCVSHDPAVDLDTTLMQAIEDVGADLVVMASHVPGLPEHIFATNAGYLANHASVSVFVIR
ncbi:universal stress protein UspA [Thalassobaculum fulvum]|uniref:Universal stress protein UspA n=1 Tax=Thalassobaculum fulvum TaxID=1633335 RepID=A0A919CQS6_9PROT|nr:universal stress protein [Thalassobaculum fulvum]GHD56421.1 universal stress protein UspA [Thalassobaculum fulvum]